MQYITEYNHDWPERFVKITECLKEFIPKSWIFHHIDSTSVPGMPAKDIIDIEYALGSLETVISCLKEAGYEHEDDLGISEREAFKPALNSIGHLCRLITYMHAKPTLMNYSNTWHIVIT